LNEDIEQQVTDLLSYAIARIKDKDYVASIVHCRCALEAILHQIHYDKNKKFKKDYSSNKKWIDSFKDYLDKEGKDVYSLLLGVNNGCNRWLHYDPNREKVTEVHHVNKVINNLLKIMEILYSKDIDYEPINHPLLKDFNRQLSEIKPPKSNLTDSARDFLKSLPEGEGKEGWKKYFESNPTATADMRPADPELQLASENFYDIIEEIHDVKFKFGYVALDELDQMKERGEVDDDGPNMPLPLPFVFFRSGKSHLFVDEFLSLCKEGNPKASWWDVSRKSSPEELASKMHLFIEWLDMRLVPEGNGGEVVQLYPALDRTPVENIDFDEIRKSGVNSILREAFRFRGVNMMRPQQLMISLANIGCDIEWVLGSRESSVEEQVKGIPNNCMKWLDYTVTKNLDGDEVLLSLKEKNHV
jgi:hypothetical protein